MNDAESDEKNRTAAATSSGGAKVITPPVAPA
jgi:hypothetical protein